MIEETINRNATLLNGDCREILKTLEADSVDSIVTDPPYELGFMGKSWDASGIAYDVSLWREALRVLKPGGHLLAFGGSRTYHRLACAIEDAGFEIRDQIMWIYGSGFPKSLDVSKAIDKLSPREGMFEAFARHYGERRAASGLAHNVVCEAGKFYANVNHGGASVNWEKGHNVPTLEQWSILQPLLGLSDEFAPLIERVEAERQVIGQHNGDMGGLGGERLGNPGGSITTPATEAAKQWDGWGTALKPAHEPIVVARKPLIGTVAETVLRHGTGALNIDGCRVATNEALQGSTVRNDIRGGAFASGHRANPGDIPDYQQNPSGRWPANVIHDGSEEVLSEFAKYGERGQMGPPCKSGSNSTKHAYGEYESRSQVAHLDTGTAARFFYAAKASKSDRGEGNNHPTVKPTALMRYLCRFVTPPGGLVLDPFTGSGSTGKAALLEGFRFIGIEQSAEYHAIAAARTGVQQTEPPATIPMPKPEPVREPDLFSYAG